MRFLAIPLFAVLLLCLTGSIKAPVQIEHQQSVVPQSTKVKPVVMKEQAVAMGMQFEHVRRSYRQNSIMDMYGNGACVADFDDDGFEDVLMVAGAGTTRRYGKAHWWNNNQASLLYRNRQGLYFTPETLSTSRVIAGFGCTIGDLNHDGWPDAVIGDVGKLHLLINRGEVVKNSRKPMASPFEYYQQAIGEDTWPTSLMVTDIDQNGVNDIVVATLVTYQNDLKVGDQDYGYQARTTTNTLDYDGQSNLVLKGITSELLQYQIVTLGGQQRTLSLARLGSRAGEQQFLAVNAKGSNSIIQGLRHSHNPLDWLTFAAVQISELNVAGRSHILIANHGSRGVQLLDVDTRLNQAWSKGLTNERIDAAQSWANIIADFNNDGTEDVFLAAGFDSPALNTPTRPQGSSNFLLLQDNLGHFEEQHTAFMPSLNRASRGAASGDFNNDGFIDLLVMNNNNFASLYLNQGNDNHWLSFDCRPLDLCINSQWSVENTQLTKTAAMRQDQPYLSHSSSRVHFGLADNTKPVTLTVKTQDQRSYYFADIAMDSHYRVNVSEQTVTAIGQSVQPSIVAIDAKWLLQVLQSKTPASLLNRLSAENVSEVARLLHLYRTGIGKTLSSEDNNINTIIAWLLAHSDRLDVRLIDLIIASENRLFIEPLINALPKLNDDDFCYLSKHLHYWFEEEEVLPETKFALLAPLLQQGLQSQHRIRRIVCAIEAVSYAEQTTMGASIIGLLEHQEPYVVAAALQALGRLKYARGTMAVEAFCSNLSSDALLLAAQCQISLQKLGIDGLNKKPTGQKSLSSSQQFMTLHPQSLLFDVGQLPLDLSQMMAYQDSPVKAHRYLAYQAYLLQRQYKSLLEQPDLIAFATAVRANYARQLDDLIVYAINNEHKMTSQLLPLISNERLQPLLQKTVGESFVGAIIDICKMRQSLAAQCKIQFATELSLSELTVAKLIELPKVQLYYLLAFTDKVRRQILARRLNPVRDIHLLHYHNLYQLIVDAESAWLETFLRMSFEQNRQVDLKWLQQVSKNAFDAQAIGSWTQLYLSHSLFHTLSHTRIGG